MLFQLGLFFCCCFLPVCLFMAGGNDVVLPTFHALVESADRKFASVRDVPLYGRGGAQGHYFQKVFKAYMHQQENRVKLVEAGLNRWEIARRIGQLYFNQYIKTSEARFLLEACVFYEAILNRGYFDGAKGKGKGKGKGKDPGVRFKELRFYSRFLLVSLIFNRIDTVKVLVERFRALVEQVKFPSPPKVKFAA